MTSCEERFQAPASLTLGHMYTGRVVRFRASALVLVLLLAATPVLGLVCAMDCDQPPATSACHESTASAGGPVVRGAHHGCDHDHTTGNPALVAGASVRDSIGAVVAVPVPTLAHASTAQTRVANAPAMHGPPGLIFRTTSSQITVLRI